MTIKSSDALAAIRKHVAYLQPQVHGDIVHALEREGLAIGGGGAIRAVDDTMHQLTPMQACDTPEKQRIWNQVRGQIRHLSGGIVDLDPRKPINAVELQRLIASGSVEDRMAIKSNLAQIGLLD